MRSSSLICTTLAKHVRNQCRVIRDSSVYEETERECDTGDRVTTEEENQHRTALPAQKGPPQLLIPRGFSSYRDDKGGQLC